MSKGGVLPGDTKDISYSEPQGPKGIMDPKSPGIHGANSGTANKPTSLDRPSGSPGIGGTNHGCCGSQGSY